MEPIFTTAGVGTKYEAAIAVFETDGYWSGYLIFRSDTLSPAEFLGDGIRIKMKYYTPDAGNGALAHHRAWEYWQDLVSVFERLNFNE